MRKIIGILSCLACMISCTAPTTSDSKTEEIHVLTTTEMIGDILTHFLPDSVTVSSLMGPGIDPHLYKPSFEDVQNIEKSSAVVYNGLHLEGKMQSIFEKMKKRIPIHAVAEFIDSSEWIILEQAPVVYDPHIWFNARAFISGVEHIAQELCTQFKLTYPQAKADQYWAEYNRRADQWKEWVETLPEEKRILITAHDAFSYFGKHFGIQVKALQGINTAAEFGVKDVKNLADFILEQNVECIFMESSISPRSLEAVQREVESKGKKLRLGSTLYSDAMGPTGAGADTFLDMIEYDLKTIVKGLNNE